ncbi:ketose-bisphosphate aldolase [Vagococcus fluvialis]|uniref:ketose-bisphosphate aldolase n=1 Tax=Vagococcus fluvialis TaxID=2738 RepID=UPI001A8EF082|nr:ketose-bisphosphate aldolase [Vagococcus fluvialis]MBO0486570.1 ketose-bisphosphate aldolase [Vagococcus fluvialis]
MLISMKRMLDVAKENKFAVGAYNISDANIFKAVVEKAEELNAPTIIAIHPDELSFVTGEFIAYVRERLCNSPVPFVLHLDHGGSIKDVMTAINHGFTSVMIDASLLPFEENIAITKKVVELAHTVGVSVEGELGTIGDTGTSIEGGVTEITYTKPEEAKEFVERTGVDTLAIAIGTAHGIYPEGFVPKLKLDLLSEIAAEVDVPLVLHGGSSNSDDELRIAVEKGIQKVNISSDIKKPYFVKLQEVLNNEFFWEPNTVFPPCILESKTVVENKMNLFSSVDKVKYFN